MRRGLISDVQLHPQQLFLLLFVFGQCVGNLFVGASHVTESSSGLFGEHADESFDSLEAAESDEALLSGFLYIVDLVADDQINDIFEDAFGVEGTHVQPSVLDDQYGLEAVETLLLQLQALGVVLDALAQVVIEEGVVVVVLLYELHQALMAHLAQLHLVVAQVADHQPQQPALNTAIDLFLVALQDQLLQQAGGCDVDFVLGYAECTSSTTSASSSSAATAYKTPARD